MMWPFKSKSRRRTAATVPVKIRGRYDAAQTTADNRRHWANADSLSADGAASASVRAILRRRARYEVENNTYAKGIVLTLANDCVGTGARLQMLTGDDEVNARVEAEFAAWAKAVNLADKLRTMKRAKTTDGETFAVFTDNPVHGHPVTLDVQVIEADRFASPFGIVSPGSLDGIKLDRYGNPATYTILRQHPGDGLVNPGGKEVAAAEVLHWFRADRPEQHRGVSELTPSLPLFAQLRRYTQAVIAAAEVAADHALVLYTDNPIDGDAVQGDPMEEIELEQRMATMLPDGWKLGGVDANQPATTYPQFKVEILNEIARAQNMPYNIAAGNSSGYNYASGRLDHQTYYKSIRIEQADLAADVLDRIFAAWLDEALRLFLIDPLKPTAAAPAHEWFFDGTEHVDPLKEANAQAVRLGSLSTTLAAEYARTGKDWETELRQRARELKLIGELGLAASPAAAPGDTPPPEPPDEDEELDDE